MKKFQSLGKSLDREALKKIKGGCSDGTTTCDDKGDDADSCRNAGETCGRINGVLKACCMGYYCLSTDSKCH